MFSLSALFCVEVIYGFINVVISPPACSNAVECHYVAWFQLFSLHLESVSLSAVEVITIPMACWYSGIFPSVSRPSPGYTSMPSVLKNEIAGGKRAD